MALNGFASPICPLTLRAGEETKVVQLSHGASAPRGIPCLGDRCAWFVTVTDKTGKVVNGACALKLMAAGLSGVVQNVGALVQLGQIEIGKKYPDLVESGDPKGSGPKAA